MESAFEILTRFDMGQGISSPYCPHFRRNVHLGILIGRRLPILLRHDRGENPASRYGIGSLNITERSPYIARTFSTQAQLGAPMGRWASKNGVKKVVTLVSDFAGGHDCEKAFAEEFKANGGEVARRTAGPTLSIPISRHTSSGHATPNRTPCSSGSPVCLTSPSHSNTWSAVCRHPAST